MPFSTRSFHDLLDGVYPLRSGLLASLYSVSVIEVVNFCIATDLELTEAEANRFLNPAKRAMAEIPDLACSHGIRRCNCLFFGKDLCKPREKLRQHASMAYSQDTMKLVLFIGCPSPPDAEGSFQCREVIVSHFRTTSECSETERSGDIVVSMPGLATTVYFPNPTKNSRWVESSILTLRLSTVDLLVEPTADGPSTCYTSPRCNGGTVDFWRVYRTNCEERSFTLPGRIRGRRYLFYTLLLECCMESDCMLLFLFTLPGQSIYRQACGRWARFCQSTWRKIPFPSN